MSLTLHPREVVQAHRPPANWVLGSVTISNNNKEHVAFEIHSKGMDAKNYFVSPESGRIVPGGSVCDVPPEDSADNKKFSDEFIIKSIFLPSDRHALAHYDFWANPEPTQWHRRQKGTTYERIFTVKFEEKDLGEVTLRRPLPALPEVEVKLPAQAAIADSTHKSETALLEDVSQLSPEVEETDYLNASSRATTGKQRASVDFRPSDTLCFQRPLTRSISRSLIIMNINTYPVAFKIKTSKPKLYCAHPYYGRVEPGQDVNVTIQSMPLPEEPPLDKKCRHKILVEIVAIIPERESLRHTPHEFFKSARENNKTEIYKFRVVYIPAEGLDPDETEHYAAGMAHSISEDLLVQEDSGALTPSLHQYALPEVEGRSTYYGVAKASTNSASGSKAYLEAAPAEFLVGIYPCHALYFQRPLTRSISRSLVIANANTYPIVFKIETKAPQAFLVHPKDGRVEAGHIAQIAIESRPLPEEPPLDINIEHIFRVKLAPIASEQMNFPVNDILKCGKKKGRYAFHLIAAVYISADGLTQELAEYATGMAHLLSDEEIPHSPTLHEVEVRPAKPSKFPEENRPSMPGVSFSPGDDDALCFQRPLTRPISRLLVISNRNPHPIAYRIKTTNSKAYFSRPTSGRVEPGQNINVTIEQVPLQEEPPMYAICKDRFSIQLATVTPEREDLSLDDVFKSAGENNEPDYHHNIPVTYLPAEGLSPEELAKYSAGIAQLIPGELFSIYPTTALCFRRPLWRPENLRGYMAITNIHVFPLAFRIMFTPSKNIRMYSVTPSSGKLESGQRLEIKGEQGFPRCTANVDGERLTSTVERQLVEEDPPLEEECADVFRFLCTVIDPEENLELSDIWARAKERDAILRKKLPVRFIPWRGLTPEEELIQAEQGVFDRLMIEDMEEYENAAAKKLEQGHENNEAAEELLTKAQEASIRKWLLPIAPRIVLKQPEPTEAEKRCL